MNRKKIEVMVCSRVSEIINIRIDYRSITDSQLSCSLDSQFPVFILGILLHIKYVARVLAVT
jgi:hypothetical protein